MCVCRCSASGCVVRMWVLLGLSSLRPSVASIPVGGCACAWGMVTCASWCALQFVCGCVGVFEVVRTLAATGGSFVSLLSFEPVFVACRCKVFSFLGRWVWSGHVLTLELVRRQTFQCLNSSTQWCGDVTATLYGLSGSWNVRAKCWCRRCLRRRFLVRCRGSVRPRACSPMTFWKNGGGASRSLSASAFCSMHPSCEGIFVILRGCLLFCRRVSGHPLAQNERSLHMFLQEPVIDRAYVPGKVRRKGVACLLCVSN